MAKHISPQPDIFDDNTKENIISYIRTQNKIIAQPTISLHKKLKTLKNHMAFVQSIPDTPALHDIPTANDTVIHAINKQFGSINTGIADTYTRWLTPLETYDRHSIDECLSHVLDYNDNGDVITPPTQIYSFIVSTININRRALYHDRQDIYNLIRAAVPIREKLGLPHMLPYQPSITLADTTPFILAYILHRFHNVYRDDPTYDPETTTVLRTYFIDRSPLDNTSERRHLLHNMRAYLPYRHSVSP